MSKLKRYDSYENLKKSKTAVSSTTKSSPMMEIEQFLKQMQQKIFGKSISGVKSKNA